MYASTQKGELTMSEVITMKRNNSDENATLAMLANDFIRKMSIHKICRVQKAGGKAILICFEEYYYRVESAVSLTVMLTQEENSQDAFIIGFGGGHGLLNISWGANESIAKKAYNALAELGFEKDDSVTGMYL